MSNASKDIFFHTLKTLAIAILKLIGIAMIFCCRLLELLFKKLGEDLEKLVGR